MHDIAAEPDATDPDRTGSSLRNLADLIFPAFEAVGAKSVVELGASHGDFTRELLEWAAGSGARITAIEPAPEPELLTLAEQHPELELVRQTSGEALRAKRPIDAIVIDGDHNYYSVSGDLRLIAERDGPMPLVLLHDLGWPHGRRDAYYAPERIPEGERQPLASDVHLDPREPGIADGGFHFDCVAEREGGPRNGVRTAVEDFVEGRDDLRLAVIPAFFGLGVLWDAEAPWADAVAKLVEPWDRNPLLERLEANRVLKLVEWVQANDARYAEHARFEWEVGEGRKRRQEQERLLRGMLQTSALAWAERLSRLRQRGRPALSREEIRRVLEDDEAAQS
jgi:Methyltransferase domain